MIKFFNKDMKNIPKLCINCKHFIKHLPNYPNQEIHNSNFGKCKLFGTFDLITGDAIYDYAKTVRTDSMQCGETGTLFENK